MASPRQQILDVAESAGFPLAKPDLLQRLEEAGVDPDVLGVATALADDHFVAAEELGHRLDDALGMPDADTRDSALTVDPDWRP